MKSLRFRSFLSLLFLFTLFVGVSYAVSPQFSEVQGSNLAYWYRTPFGYALSDSPVPLHPSWASTGAPNLQGAKTVGVTNVYSRDNGAFLGRVQMFYP